MVSEKKRGFSGMPSGDGILNMRRTTMKQIMLLSS